MLYFYLFFLYLFVCSFRVNLRNICDNHGIDEWSACVFKSSRQYDSLIILW